MAQKKVETPWHKDDVLEVTIEDMDQDGNGIGHTEDGYTLFIKDAVIGDKVTAKVMKATPKYAFAKLEEITERSPFRVEPKCDISNKCGGCQIQSLDYEHQLAFKERKVRGDLIRIGGFPAERLYSLWLQQARRLREWRRQPDTVLPRFIKPWEYSQVKRILTKRSISVQT